jgi:spermidine synthase
MAAGCPSASSRGQPRTLGRGEIVSSRPTDMGELSLRRRADPVLGPEVYEVRLGEEYLMSSAFTVAEQELARLGLSCAPGRPLHVLVGGLGLGYTAVAALEDDRVASLTVVEALEPVIEWHRQNLLPTSAQLLGDSRVRLVHGDFFALTSAAELNGLTVPEQVLDVVLVDIDHTPDHLLHASHGGFYTAEGLRRLRDQMAPDGVFGLWSDDPPHEAFLSTLRQAFGNAEAHVVPFANPLTGGTASNTVYLARRVGHRVSVSDPTDA